MVVLSVFETEFLMVEMLVFLQRVAVKALSEVACWEEMLDYEEAD